MNKKFDCLDCTVDVYKTDGVYMLKDTVWSQIHNSPKGFLCIDCAEKRLGRPLNKEDFNNSYVNQPGFGTRSVKLSKRMGLLS